MLGMLAGELVGDPAPAGIVGTRRVGSGPMLIKECVEQAAGDGPVQMMVGEPALIDAPTDKDGVGIGLRMLVMKLDSPGRDNVGSPGRDGNPGRDGSEGS